jgi:hemin uptake protein HemP
MTPMSIDEQARSPHTEVVEKAGERELPRTVSSQELLQGDRELWIEHEGQLYRLRVTSRGKLYLTK